jgi:hypothetical protein
MFSLGKCPSCGQMVMPNLRSGPIGDQLAGPLVSGFIAVCPRCQTILGVLPDPSDIAAKVVNKLSAKGR